MESSKSNGATTGNLLDDREPGLNGSECNLDAIASGFTSSEVPSWEGLAGLLPGFTPDDIQPLAAARELESVYPMLHALTRGALGDFFVRVAALESLIADGRSPLATAHIEEVLYWLNDNARDLVMRTLRGSGGLLTASPMVTALAARDSLLRLYSHSCGPECAKAIFCQR